MKNTRILLVCMGNICRSPMAEGIIRAMAQERRSPITTDSAGTIGHHIGEAPDPRAQANMLRHGIDISDLRARQVAPEDFHTFDLLLAMDASNLRGIRMLAPDASLISKARLIMDYAPEHALREVPDPYYGGDAGFEAVHDMLSIACARLLDQLDADAR